jgi:hypothetical protein
VQGELVIEWGSLVAARVVFTEGNAQTYTTDR